MNNEHDNAVTQLSATLDCLSATAAEHPVTYLRLAGRMAVVFQQTNYLEAALKHPWAQERTLEEALVESCKAQFLDLRDAPGEDQGLAVIAAQDLACLLKLPMTARRLGAKARECIEALVDAAEETLLNPQAAEAVEAFRDRFNIPAEYRLAVIDCPLTEVELLMVEAIGQAAEQPAAEEIAPVVIPLHTLLVGPARAAASRPPEESLQEAAAQPQEAPGAAGSKVTISLSKEFEKKKRRVEEEIPWAEDELEIASIIVEPSTVIHTARVRVRTGGGHDGVLEITLATGGGAERKEAKVVLTREEPRGEFRGDSLPADLRSLEARLITWGRA